MSRPVRRARYAVLLTHGFLLITVVLWQLATHPARSGWVLALLAALPLLLPWYGLLREHRFTYIWGTLCVMPYLVLGVMEGIANPAERGWASTCILLALCFFAAQILYLRVTRPAPF